MTAARIIYEGDTFYHVINRVAGPKDYFPLDDVVKQKFLDLMNHLLELHGGHIKILSYVLMDNHYHLVISHNPDKILPESEVLCRFKKYYQNESIPKAWQHDSYEKVLIRMKSLSKFMGELDRRIATWFNQIYSPHKDGKIRRGHFWQDRFKSTVIDSVVGVRNCIAYVECNPLRARIVKHPGDYHFSSYGVYKGSGRHPFALNFANYFLEDEYDSTLGFKDKFYKCMQKLEDYLVNKLKIERFLSNEESQRAMEENPFAILTRRVRYWEDSKIIFCKMKKSEIEQNIYEKKMSSRKIVHKFKDKAGHVFQPLSWHQMLTVPDW